MAKKSTKNTENNTNKRRPWNAITMSPEEFDDLSLEYFDKCEREGVRAVKPLLARYCGISTSTYDRWEKNEDGRHSKHAEVIKRNTDLMAGKIQQENSTMAIYLSKQPCYGGLSDKQDNSGEYRVTVDVLSNGSKIVT